MSRSAAHDQLPIIPLLILAMAAFVTIVTEALPAGLLTQFALGLNISESLAGQSITIYAVGSLLTAIPLTNLSQNIRRKPLLLIALLGFALTNLITTLSSSYLLTMIARFLAGVSAGLLWALLAGYATRMAPEALKGRAIAIAMIGTPLALSLGVPAGTYLGQMLGWRMAFAVMSIFAIMLVLWGWVALPDFDGQATDQKVSLKQVFILPGVRAILFTVLSFVLAHNLLYTYIVPFLSLADLTQHINIILLIFGCLSLFSIFITAMLIDQHLRLLTLCSIILFGFAALLLNIMGHHAPAVYLAVGIWGIAFGGAATLFQTALAKTTDHMADIAQSMLVTVWNIAIAGGGIIGGFLLSYFSVSTFPIALLILLLMTFMVVWRAKPYGFC
ncbi:MFS transporter [Acinetobacter larvae]|uniref:MFS transporter n=1 Tax=Acinetobacter larvae TaxID=1789224 RepID=A0A1B2M357_9GAMM|nr:MFS transporter [Acinetobacter larvae]AOA59635.1 MFS transporter [Acinetobacter larvae]